MTIICYDLFVYLFEILNIYLTQCLLHITHTKSYNELAAVGLTGTMI